ncbi:restriction endonuclease [Streptomyces sp. NPDC006460]|uniref:restriction endonuclease n=1 Tax=Streptomyces sp. NPDC006460 TaxID=3154304 RepID=UPI00339DF37D
MTTAGQDRRVAGRGTVPIGRDVVLAVGLVGTCVGGLALFLKTVESAGSRTAVLPLLIVATLVVAMVIIRWSVSPVRGRLSAPPAEPWDAADAYVTTAPDVPDVGPEALDHAAVDADGFEHTIAALCVRDGCSAVEVVGGAGDLGADVIATTADGRRVVVQCKHYADHNRVGSQDLQRFGGTCFTVHEADVAVVVTTSSFTAPAMEYAATCGIVCVDGDALTAWTELTILPPWDTPDPDVPPAAAAADPA